MAWFSAVVAEPVGFFLDVALDLACSSRCQDPGVDVGVAASSVGVLLDVDDRLSGDRLGLDVDDQLVLAASDVGSSSDDHPLADDRLGPGADVQSVRLDVDEAAWSDEAVWLDGLVVWLDEAVWWPGLDVAQNRGSHESVADRSVGDRRGSE